MPVNKTEASGGIADASTPTPAETPVVSKKETKKILDVLLTGFDVEAFRKHLKVELEIRGLDDPKVILATSPNILEGALRAALNMDATALWNAAMVVLEEEKRDG